ncbi:hypothetical protein B4135_1521 [Caldibacillus debilis]|uniref:Uncharacterized protein n=1 Tax=Caldibacillus debilis TaxID=301148 RepID=A0A150MC22_9BACI|nr:hypothetical protein B4135_1521 [Caldibacillus debilis]
MRSESLLQKALQPILFRMKTKKKIGLILRPQQQQLPRRIISYCSNIL